MGLTMVEGSRVGRSRVRSTLNRVVSIVSVLTTLPRMTREPPSR